ncbi:MarR family transcriptional regulator [Vibrio sp. FNV 38]|nr:MarR family transcriptional regulator [Vibrio sp. FNV 38]
MSIETTLVEFERYHARAWRVYANQDPLCQLSFNEFDYLRVIKDSGEEGVRVTDLAQALSVTKPSASNMVARLERKKMIRRLSCPEDARSKRIVLTSEVIEGWALENIVYQDIAQQMRRKLSGQEMDQLEKLLNKVLA